ncbi:acyl-CoA thioesterase domain-containing protein [Trujillonella endophytica]|uniref:Acyl-CoA thioesterase-2 n=1 Tax=Trujillonella endophytica TaxID=673521 RepID=A0A1H8UPH2_9ACTN|nr:acyl-CoA thioesterase domain-containing protein [Trujillella endophytica]SEP04917.1 acyl-CoA thioesterase-2 [Trujillella endophytica]
MFPRTPAELAPLLDLRPRERGFTVDTLPTDHGAILGAHELLQQVLAAERAAPGKRVLSLHTVFSSGGRSGEPVDIAVETTQSGRSFAGVTLTLTQGPLLISRAVVLLTADEPDTLHHRAPGPRPAPPDDWTEIDWGLWPGRTWQRAPGESGEVAQRLATEGLAGDPGVERGLIAMSTEALVMSALITRLEGGFAFRQGSSNVLAQSVTFLEPVDGAEALVVTAVPTYAGRGRAHGTGTVTDDDGRLLATFQTTGVLRGPSRPPA